MAMVPKIPGHSIRVEPTTSGRRWRIRCECGFGGDQPNNPGMPTRTYATDVVALATAIRHLHKVQRDPVDQARRDGVSTRPLHRTA